MADIQATSGFYREKKAPGEERASAWSDQGKSLAGSLFLHQTKRELLPLTESFIGRQTDMETVKREGVDALTKTEAWTENSSLPSPSGI